MAKNGAGSFSGSRLPDVRLATSDMPALPRRGASLLYAGAHRPSLAAAKAGRGDAAAMDCVALSLLRRFATTKVEGTAVVARPPSAPALSFVTGASQPPAFVAALWEALLAVAADPALWPTLGALNANGLEVSDGTCALAAYDTAIARRQRVTLSPKGLQGALEEAAGPDSAAELAARATRDADVSGHESRQGQSFGHRGLWRPVVPVRGLGVDLRGTQLRR